MTFERNTIRWNGWGWAAHKDSLAERDDVWNWLAGELGMPSLLATPARPLEEISLAPSRLSAAERTLLVAIVGADRVRDDTYERAFHALGRSYHDLLRLRAGDLTIAPDAVLYPRGADEILAILALASEAGIGVVECKLPASVQAQPALPLELRLRILGARRGGCAPAQADHQEGG